MCFLKYLIKLLTSSNPESNASLFMVTLAMTRLRLISITASESISCFAVIPASSLQILFRVLYVVFK